MIYFHVLQSQAEPERYYAGVTEDRRTRLKAHNFGKVSHIKIQALAREHLHWVH